MTYRVPIALISLLAAAVMLAACTAQSTGGPGEGAVVIASPSAGAGDSLGESMFHEGPDAVAHLLYGTELPPRFPRELDPRYRELVPAHPMAHEY